MQLGEREELEREIRRRLDLGDLAGAATVALRGYGPELFGFLIAFQRDEQAAADVFSDVTEAMWKGLPSFQGQCSFRTWAYKIARNASVSHLRSERHRARRQRPLPEGSELSALSALAAEIRSATRTLQRTETRNRAAKLRESLSREDQELLVLRVDKKLSFNDLARVLHEGDEPLDDAAIKRESTRLRKRFQLVKERLVQLGRAQGLVAERRRAT